MRCAVFFIGLVLSSHAWASGDLVAAFKEACAEEKVSNAVIVVLKTGEAAPLFETRLGEFTKDREFILASASKWVTTVAILSLVKKGKLRLEDTVASWMARGGQKPWTGDKAKITVEQLLAFTSGLAPESDCVTDPKATLASCADEIGAAPLARAPGTAFDYGATHLQVAGRVAEIASGLSWAELFEQEVRAPLGLSESAKYYTFAKPRQGKHPRLGGGLVMSVSDYLKFLNMLANDGGRILTPDLVRRMEKDATQGLKVETRPEGATEGSFIYGLGHRIECAKGDADCKEPYLHSSAGSLGFYPWIDRRHDYVAVFATEGEGTAGRGNRIVHKLLAKIQRLAKPDVANSSP